MSELDKYIIATFVGLSMGWMLRQIVENIKEKLRSKIRRHI
jgi:hypothetical protein